MNQNPGSTTRTHASAIRTRLIGAASGALHLIACVIALAMVAPAHAQVYKCKENGKSVFSDRPCSADDVPLSIRPATGGYDATAGEAAEARAAKEQADLQRLELERQAARAEEIKSANANPSGSDDNCARIRADLKKAEYWAREFQHPDNVHRELNKAKKLKDRLWWECKQIP
jgi:hypothetical protein